MLEDALRQMQKPTFDVDLEVMVRSIQFFHNTLLPSYIHMYIHVSPFRFPLGSDDSGGFTRELPKEILNRYMYMEPTGIFRHNAVALQVKMFTEWKCLYVFTL